MSKYWLHETELATRNFICGYCGFRVASQKGWLAHEQPASGRMIAYIYVCPGCRNPTYFDEINTQNPGIAFGETVHDIDEKSVQDLYEEARRCTSANAYTAAVLSCRKLLMHIAVLRGAEEKWKFIKYVEYLADKNYIPPGAKGWVDHIREKGNEANHEIVIMSKAEAEDLLSFIGMLLKVIYEFPSRIKKKGPPVQSIAPNS